MKSDISKLMKNKSQYNGFDDLDNQDEGNEVKINSDVMCDKCGAYPIIGVCY